MENRAVGCLEHSDAFALASVSQIAVKIFHDLARDGVYLIDSLRGIVCCGVQQALIHLGALYALDGAGQVNCSHILHAVCNVVDDELCRLTRMIRRYEQVIFIVNGNPGHASGVHGVVENIILSGELQGIRVIRGDNRIVPHLAVLQTGIYSVVHFAVAYAAYVCTAVIILELLRYSEDV